MAPAEKPSACFRVELVRCHVFAQLAGSENTLSAGSEVCAGQILRAEKNSYAVISHPGGHSISAGPGSQLELKSVAYHSKTDQLRAELLLVRGRLRLQTKRGDDIQLRVGESNIVAGGADVVASQSTDKTDLVVLRGLVSIVGPASLSRPLSALERIQWPSQRAISKQDKVDETSEIERDQLRLSLLPPKAQIRVDGCQSSD